MFQVRVEWMLLERCGALARSCWSSGSTFKVTAADDYLLVCLLAPVHSSDVIDLLVEKQLRCLSFVL